MFVKRCVAILLIGVLVLQAAQAQTTQYTLTDARGPARSLDGIGGLSGGGATSVFLRHYPEPQRSDILDYLFKPNFGASLHILKVEIGGDAQSTDGSEASHMHTPWDENYSRGYEWWLMQEAKKRNPNIKLYGLAWAYPQWVTCRPGTMEGCTNDIYTYPNTTAKYIAKWIAGARNTYGLEMDYVGCWNERPYNDTYLKTLRRVLDENGFHKIKIVAPDGSWDIAKDILKDPALAAAVYGIGAHYPGTTTTDAAEKTGKPLWASEDDSTYNNAVGAGCWARIINQNYVNGNMTATINWNLIAAYMKGTNWYRAGLMSAMQPWNGAYGTYRADGSWTAGPMIWATAHTTQFTTPGSSYYLHVGDAAGLLKQGGSYVTLVDSTTKDVTIVIEKMSRDYSSCVRPILLPYSTSDERATFTLSGGLAKVQTLHVWYTHWATQPPDVTVEFKSLGTVAVVQGRFSMNISVNSLYTLTTVGGGAKGAHAKPPQSTLFPTRHTDDFEDCPISSEGKYFTDQNGGFECVLSGDPRHNVVMQQMVPMKPVTWGGDIRPHSLIGHRDGVNHSMVVDAFIPEPGMSVLLGLRVQNTDDTLGILWGVDTSQQWGLWPSMDSVNTTSPLASGRSPVKIGVGEWHTYRIDVNGTVLTVWIDGVVATKLTILSTTGHALIGTYQYAHYTQFDNFQLYTSYAKCGSGTPTAGAAVRVVDCNSEVGLRTNSEWSFTAKPNDHTPATISLRSNPNLCLRAVGQGASDPWWLQLAPCNSTDLQQRWAWFFDGIAPDSERASWIYLPASNRCLDVYQQKADLTSPMDAWPCNAGANQAFWYDYNTGEIGNEATATCLGVCV